MHRALPALFFLAVLINPVFSAESAPQVEFFSPQGAVKAVRQVTARFSEPMVPFGDPRLVEPFDIECPAKGTARWADARNWVFDFDRNLPAGVACRFHLKADLKTFAGKPVEGDKEFSFTTGGPAIRQSLPYEGTQIDEEQVFVLGLDAPADTASILANTHCQIAGVEERVGVRLLTAAERKAVLEQRRDFVDRYVRAFLIYKRDGRVVPLDTRAVIKGSDFEKFLGASPDETPIVALQCQRRFPNNAQVRLIWGKGIRTVSGIATETEQALAWRVRGEFRAEFHCERVNADAQCIPVLPMNLGFSAPVARELAAKIELRSADGKVRRPEFGEDLKDPVVHGVSFAGPFPEKVSYTLALPPEFRDDAGRTPANRDAFPLAVRTDEYPPLAKFPARFGILELNAEATLPLTVRNVEAQLALSELKVAGSERLGLTDRLKRSWGAITGKEEGPLKARVLRVWKDAEPEVLNWFKRLNNRRYPEGSQSIFESEGEAQSLTLPKPNGARAFEVMGIPLKDPGFYVVEIASPRLGAALLKEEVKEGEKPKPLRPYYVQTAALVTNLSAHFKHGRESSLVWVTTLDKGAPVAGADVEVRDCGGTVHWKGNTDGNGVARIAQVLPPERDLPSCFHNYDHKYFVTARKDDDLTFTFSDWNEGISPWRFQLPTAAWGGPYIATTVFDRTLLRAGEIVHMKHFYRRHTGAGFELIEKSKLPAKLTITHLGSDQKYEMPLVWDDQGTAETEWHVPEDSRLGSFQVQLASERSTAVARVRNLFVDGVPDKVSGTFRVEAFRVPSMKAVMKPMATSLVNAASAEVDIQVNYLAGGGASGASVKLRSLVEPRALNFPDFEGYVLANGNVKEGVERHGGERWYSGDYEMDEPGEEAGAETETPEAGGPVARGPTTRLLTLDAAGGTRVTIDKLPKVETPHSIQAELEYQDANGETLTASTRVPLWPAKVIVGIKPDSWAAGKDKLKFQALALDLNGKPRANVAIKVDLLQRIQYSHRKRLIGGFYAYEHATEVKRLRDACEGRTDTKGLLVCEVASSVSGNVVVRARATDESGNAIYAHQDMWVAGKDEWWFDVGNDDRMDVLPEKKRYEPGETAVFQIRMPFREATALVTVEREGVMESFVTQLSGKAPVVSVPIKGNYAPNTFVSVLAVRGRVAGVQPTALVDLGKPAFKLGIAEIRVGWRAHELKVGVTADRQVYQVREKARVRVKVRNADGVAPAGGEVALAAVDEGLLELMPNDTWDLLKPMMARRGIEVQTSTAQMHVVGRRHYGRKALPPGGGGGRETSRELFDTLLLWRGRVTLDANGEAQVDVPLNDSLTAFRIVAVANAGAGFFGSGETTIRSSQDVMLMSGLPPLVRELDRFSAGVTVRNGTARPMDLSIKAAVRVTESDGMATPPPALKPVAVKLAPGEARAVDWEVIVPVNARKLGWEFTAERGGKAEDRMRISQQVIPAVRVRTFQATLMQLDKSTEMPVQIPGDAIPGRGGINVHVRARLADELVGVQEYMSLYPYTCLEQRVSQAVALRDESRWKRVMLTLPAYLDRDGLAKYFPLMHEGSDTLTSYLIAIADEAGWEIPDDVRERMVKALTGFVQGRVVRYSALPTADLTLRKLSALNALARVTGGVERSLVSSITIDPNLWPTSGVLDWIDVLKRSANIPDREAHLDRAIQILRSRLNFQGTIMTFSTERSDMLWWLMCSGDVNANRAIVSLLDNDRWREDMPRLVRGAVGRQHKGHWNTTVANAWGTLALEKFSEKFESEKVAGRTNAELGGTKRGMEWNASSGGTMSFGWPAGGETLKVDHAGNGKPWVTVQSLAAIPLKEPFSTGYKIKRTVTPVDRKAAGTWSRGDVYRVTLELDAQSDMTWVVVHDPIPSGASILGTGLGRDSQLLTRGERRQGWVWPAFEERTFDSFRAYYEFVPKGRWTVEYTVRLNNPGSFTLPETRVEALYSPEMFGEIPNAGMEIKP
jgi:alpha-2-macroglobulin